MPRLPEVLKNGLSFLFSPKPESSRLLTSELKPDPTQQMLNGITQSLDNSLDYVEAEKRRGRNIGIRESFIIHFEQKQAVIDRFASGDGVMAVSGSEITIYPTGFTTIIGDPVYLWISSYKVVLTTDPLFIGKIETIKVPLKKSVYKDNLTYISFACLIKIWFH